MYSVTYAYMVGDKAHLIRPAEPRTLEHARRTWRNWHSTGRCASMELKIEACEGFPDFMPWEPPSNEWVQV